ncbi:hypothetical protein Lal_00026356 [Lupinus albus]|nr:hypothetical protein Lal_00026356 [Lupinus albus]
MNSSLSPPINHPLQIFSFAGNGDKSLQINSCDTTFLNVMDIQASDLARLSQENDVDIVLPVFYVADLKLL